MVEFYFCNALMLLSMYLLCVCVFVCKCMCIYLYICMWRSENNSLESFLSYQLVGSRDWPQVIRHPGKHLYTQKEHITSPHSFSLLKLYCKELVTKETSQSEVNQNKSLYNSMNSVQLEQPF